MANVPPHLRMAYKILRNAGYVPEEVALQKEISRLEDLLENCTDEKIKIQQMKKLDFLRVKLDTKMNRKLRFDSDSPTTRRWWIESPPRTNRLLAITHHRSCG